MSLLDQPHWNVTVHAWHSHTKNHRIMPDPTCVFCDYDQWEPGREQTNETRSKGEQ